LLISTIVDFFVGRAIHESDESSTRKKYLTISVITNLSILGFFKYFNFFTDGFIELLSVFGMNADYPTLNVILPVGISFYTFQTMSYTIDIYRRRLQPTYNIFNFALFVSFFPQLVAGPIERAATLLPQIETSRKITLSKIDAGLFLILWGFFKKVVIADNVSIISNQVFGGYLDLQGIDVIVGILAFTIQIYCDFSAYSDIARGICKLMGFELMVNFRLPYFAINPSDFWNRWHISLSTWLRDYLYIPLGGNRKGNAMTYRNLTLTMLLGGLWHGAAWNFIIWGAYHGGILAIYRFFETNPKHNDPWSGGLLGHIGTMFKILLMFFLTLIGWVIFRSNSAHQIIHMLQSSFLISANFNFSMAYELMFYSFPLLIMQVCQYLSGDLLVIVKLGAIKRGLIYGLLFFGILVFGVSDSMEFIYFQF